MRKVILAAVLAALGSAALAVPAFGSFDHHFTVFENARFHVLSNERVFTIRGGLYDPLNHDDRVGSDHARCQILPPDKLRSVALATSSTGATLGPTTPGSTSPAAPATSMESPVSGCSRT